jgi:DNA-binding IclR family transcriptional regulator
MSDNTQTAVKSADRVLDLLELLARAGREMAHNEIGEALQIPKSSLTQLLRNLIARGYVEVTPSGRGYRLGPTLLSLSQSAGQARDLMAQAEASLADITRETGESSALNQLKGDEAEVVATILGPARLVTHMRLGDLAPLYATSGGKAILAYMPSDFQKEYFGRVRFNAATPATLKSASAVRKQLNAIRETGVAYSHEEWTPGIIGIAVPVLDAGNAPVGAINVAVPAVRFSPGVKAKAEAALKRVTDDLRRHLMPKRTA